MAVIPNISVADIEVTGGAAGTTGVRVTSFTDDSANAGNRTVNKIRGKSAIAAGQASAVITNSFCIASSMVIATLETTGDGTLTNLKGVAPGNGSFTITGNANATGNVTVSWVVIN